MTDERKNTIWAFLTSGEKSKYSKEYLSPTEDDWDAGYEAALQNIFGRHNLTAQAEEECTKSTENGISDSKIQSDSAESVESVETSTKEDAYFAYRLDLAKGIAIALLNNTNKDTRGDDLLPYAAVKMTNEIVKRLKETE